MYYHVTTIIVITTRYWAAFSISPYPTSVGMHKYRQRHFVVITPYGVRRLHNLLMDYSSRE